MKGVPMYIVTIRDSGQKRAVAREIYVTGVKKRAHCCGAGRAMFAAFEEYARDNGYRIIQVKTVASGHYPEYGATVAFYRGVGFLPLEVFPALWDENNPCLILVKAL